MCNIHPKPEYRFFTSLVNDLNIATVTIVDSEGANDTVVLDGEGVSRPLMCVLEIEAPSLGLEVTDDERRLRFGSWELHGHVRMP